jgi:Domain of unknown function (DUF4326)
MNDHPELVEQARVDLAGAESLACWCPLDSPCHADVLAELVSERGASWKLLRPSERLEGGIDHNPEPRD